nr:F-box protein CPR30-like [Ipomoea batatas]GMD35439.1 F-box protein CPR30-like [Ipomoea batatas]
MIGDEFPGRAGSTDWIYYRRLVLCYKSPTHGSFVKAPYEVPPAAKMCVQELTYSHGKYLAFPRVCLCFTTKVAVWNPGIRELRLLIQESEFPYSDSLCLYSQAFGFGTNPVYNEYKAIRVSDFSYNSTENWRRNPVVFVYSLGTDSWKHFVFEGSSNVRARNMVKSCGTTFLDVCFYWKLVDNRRAFEFDMRKEEFQEIQNPELFKFKQGDLALYYGSVAMFFYDFVDNIIDSQKREAPPQHTSFTNWNLIWGLKTPHRWKVFIWRALRGILPMKDRECVCRNAREVWRLGGYHVEVVTQADFAWLPTWLLR